MFRCVTVGFHDSDMQSFSQLVFYCIKEWEKVQNNPEFSLFVQLHLVNLQNGEKKSNWPYNCSNSTYKCCFGGLAKGIWENKEKLRLISDFFPKKLS